MDLITHVPKLEDMKAETIAMQGDKNSALAKYFTVSEDGVTFNIAKAPVTHSKDGQTVSLIRGISRDIIELSSSIKVLGECVVGEYVFDSDEAKLIYESIYNTKAVTVQDEYGNDFEYTPPYKMGVFF